MKDAKALADNLTSGDPVRVTKAVAMPRSQSISQDAATQLRTTMTGVVFDPTTFRALGQDTAAVGAETSAGKWTTYLVLIDGTWRISITSNGVQG